MKNFSGFSLIELIITIAIMGIVLTASTLSFNSWVRKSNIEKQLRELFTDLNDARIQAFHEKKTYRMTFQPSSYELKSYNTENDIGTTIINKSLMYGLTKKSNNDLTADITGKYVEFDSRGLTSNNITIVVNPLSTDTSVNCLVVYDTRTNLGKINGTDCEFR